MQPSPGSLSLTFDDGPDEHWTRAVLHALARCRVRATFFMLGERVQAAPMVARAVVRAGHDVQLHAHRHVRHSELGAADIEFDTQRAIDALATLGVRPTHWRTPWGVRTGATETVAARRCLTLVDWTIDTHDWRGDRASAMLAAARPKLTGAAVVLMHDALGPGALRAGCENTVELIEPLVDAARSRGMRVGSIACADASREDAAIAPAGDERDGRTLAAAASGGAA
jgi:peptidoglycan/xylan/chitin deacetylase (PgdA/CDA1 family)